MQLPQTELAVSAAVPAIDRANVLQGTSEISKPPSIEQPLEKNSAVTARTCEHTLNAWRKFYGGEMDALDWRTPAGLESTHYFNVAALKGTAEIPAELQPFPVGSLRLTASRGDLTNQTEVTLQMSFRRPVLLVGLIAAQAHLTPG